MALALQDFSCIKDTKLRRAWTNLAAPPPFPSLNQPLQFSLLTTRGSRLAHTRARAAGRCQEQFSFTDIVILEAQKGSAVPGSHTAGQLQVGGWTGVDGSLSSWAVSWWWWGFIPMENLAGYVYGTLVLHLLLGLHSIDPRCSCGITSSAWCLVTYRMAPDLTQACVASFLLLYGVGYGGS